MIYLVFLFGVIAGSFLNVVIYRLRSGEPIGFSRSFCPKCRTQLKWYDLVPLLSFVWLKGRCRYCGREISWQYPVVEILSGFIWVGVFYKVFGFYPPIVPPLVKGGLGGVFDISFLIFFYYVFILSFLLVIAVYDFRWQIIPNKIVYPAIVVVLFFNLFEVITPPFNPPLIKGGGGGVLVASIAFLFFFLIYYFSKSKAMGLGDAKLAFLIGLFLSPLSAIIAFVLAFVVGALCGIILIWFDKKTLKSQIAFGPFLVLGAAIAFFFSDFVFKYLNF